MFSFPTSLPLFEVEISPIQSSGALQMSLCATQCCGCNEINSGCCRALQCRGQHCCCVSEALSAMELYMLLYTHVENKNNSGKDKSSLLSTRTHMISLNSVADHSPTGRAWLSFFVPYFDKYVE